jgi:hypothetical protein
MRYNQDDFSAPDNNLIASCFFIPAFSISSINTMGESLYKSHIGYHQGTALTAT